MNKRAAIGRALEYGLELGGGAAAGFLDAKYPDKKIGGENGVGYGTILAGAGLAFGILGIGGRLGHYAGDIGAGAAAFEVGKMVAAKTQPASGSSVTSAVRGVGALPSARHVSQSDIRQALRDLSAV